MLKIQKFIQDINDIEVANTFLQEKKSIRVKKDRLPHKNGRVSTVYVYNYNQYRTDKNDPIGQECRGLILNAEGEVVSMSFPRFFNLGENEATDIEWKGARAEKKEDGTLITIYRHKGEWFIQTRSTSAGEAKMCNGTTSYGTIVKAFLTRKFKNLRWSAPFDKIGTHLCFVFEFISPYNRIVTPYDESDLILLSIFNKDRVEECPIEAVEDCAKFLGFTRPETKIINDVSDAVKWIGDMEEVEEGLVIVDKYNRRIKMKNIDYLRIAKLVNAGEMVTPKQLLEIVREEKVDDIVAHFPEWEPILTHMEEKIAEIVDELHTVFHINRHRSQKNYAFAVKDHPLSSLLFLIKKNPNIDLEEEIKKVKEEKLIEFIIDLDEKEFKRRFEDALMPDRNASYSTNVIKL